MGGRANWNGTNGDEGAQREPTARRLNNFQGRYIIRHYWDKPVACKDPRYDDWGGPPEQSVRRPQRRSRAPRAWRPRRAGRSSLDDGGAFARAAARASRGKAPPRRRTK